jgi:hypothetical protein
MGDANTFEIICVAVDLVEKFDGNGIISSLREVDTSFEVSATQVKTDGHVRFVTLETIVVEFDVGVQYLVRVDPNFFHSLNHGNGAKVREKRVINLNVPASSLVQVCNFLAIRFCNVAEVSFLAVVSISGKRIISMTKMKPFRRAL